MAFTIDRFLGLFNENFSVDRDQHIANLRIIRAFFDLPYDILPMTQKSDLPTAADWPVGSLVVVLNAVSGEPDLWINKTTGWTKVRDFENTP